jgi:hypothetical protein
MKRSGQIRDEKDHHKKVECVQRPTKKASDNCSSLLRERGHGFPLEVLSIVSKLLAFIP